MPEVKRTIPNGHRPPVKAPPPKSTSSLLSRATSITELPESPIHMLLYGRNGTGKTTMACKFPKPLLLVACEYAQTGGAQSVRNVQGVNYLHVKASKDVETLGAELQRDSRYASVVFDSGSALEEIVLADVCGWASPTNMIAVGTSRPGAKVTMDEFTERSNRMRNLLFPILTLNKHVVLICNEKDHNPQESRKSSLARANDVLSESFFGAAMGGGTARWCQDACDWVCQLYVAKEVVTTQKTVGEGKNAQIKTVEKETGKVVRHLRLKYHPNFSSRVRAPMGDTKDEIPDHLVNPEWDDIEAVLKGR